MPSFRRPHRAVAMLFSAAFVGLTACQDGTVTPRTVTPPVEQMSNLGTYMVDVNLKTGKITTHQISVGGTPSSVDASIIGGTSTIQHTFTLVGGNPTANNHFTLTDRIENKELFAIGTHVAHAFAAFPEDTMGVYVFVSILPVVNGGCTDGVSGCGVTVDSTDGAYPFTLATPQPYMYFKTILEPADANAGSGRDYTNQTSIGGIDYYRSIVFKASTLVTDFRFGVTVSAALVKPNATRWKVAYTGDSLPNRIGTGFASASDLRSEPDWRKGSSATSVVDTSIVATGCPGGGTSKCLRISSATPVPTADDSLFYYRSDSLGAADSAYIFASVTVTGNTPNNPAAFVGMQDRARLILFGIAKNKIGFCDATGAFVGGAVTLASGTTSYRVVKYGTNHVSVYLNGSTTSAKDIAYSALPGAPPSSTPNRYFWFGNRVQGASNPAPSGDVSLWSNVSYEIGATGP